MNLNNICSYISEKISVSELNLENYISTENMLPNKSGITLSANLPNITQTNSFDIGDVLVSNIRPYFKKIWYAKFNGGCSNDVLVFRANENIDSKFLYYILSDDNFFDYSMKTSKGTKMPRGDKTAIMKYLVPDFSPEVQRRIAGALSALDDKIELNNKINQNLETQAQTLFNEYFPDIFSGNSCVGNYISPKRGKNLLSKDAVIGDVPVIAGGLQPATYHNVANTIAPVITISASGANAGFVGLWNIPVWSSDSSFIDSSITPFVYFWYVMLKLRQKEIFDAQTGSAQPHIYPQHIERLPLSDLDMKKVKEYNEIISSLFEKIGYNTEENNKLSQLRDTLLPKLISGEIRV